LPLNKYFGTRFPFFLPWKKTSECVFQFFFKIWTKFFLKNAFWSFYTMKKQREFPRVDLSCKELVNLVWSTCPNKELMDQWNYFNTCFEQNISESLWNLGLLFSQLNWICIQHNFLSLLLKSIKQKYNTSKNDKTKPMKEKWWRNKKN
jgi:hypothetical protein